MEHCSGGHPYRITERDALYLGSVHPSRDGRFVHPTAGLLVRRVTIEAGKAEDLWTVLGVQAQGTGMVSLPVGAPPASSRCDRYCVLHLARHGANDLVVIELTQNEARHILGRDSVPHVQVQADDGTMLCDDGTYEERLWTVRVDGSDHRSHDERCPGEGIAHEVWLAGTLE